MKAGRVTAEMVETRKRSRRDAHSVRTRLKAFHRRERRRARTLRRIRSGRLEIPEEWGLYLIVGHKGVGKSQVMTEDAEKDWCQRGRPVFSNLGIEFGYQIDALDIYLAISRMPENSTLIIDEAHQPLGNIGSHSLKHLSIRQMLAGLRKGNQKVVMATSQMNNLDPRIIAEVDWCLAPAHAYPGRDKAVNMDGRGAYAGRPWAWKKVRKVGPKPFRGEASKLLAPFKINIDGPPPKRYVRYIEPRLMWRASQGYDSFAPLLNPMDTGMGVKAEDIREGLMDDDASWIDFGEEGDEQEHNAAANLAQAEYENNRYGLFLNALFASVQGRGMTRGNMTMAWAVDKVRDIISDWDGEHPLIRNLAALHKPGYHSPTEFTAEDAAHYLSQYIGASGGTWSVTRFLEETRHAQHGES